MKLRASLAAAGLIAATSLMLIFAACGGDDSSSSSGGSTSSGTGSDEQYVASICKAMAKFQDSLTKATSDPSKLSNPDDMVKVFSGPFDQLVKDMQNAKPPKDVKDYHDQVVKAFQKASDSLKKDKSMDALTNATSDLPNPPKAVQDRLTAAAGKNDDCKKANFDFNQ